MVVKTEFASAKRTSQEQVLLQYQYFAGNPVLNDMLGKLDQYVVVLNSDRQVIYANNSFLNNFDLVSIEDALGRRVGEILDCRSAWVVAGCGTSDFCRECGVVQSVLESQEHNTDNSKECIILTKKSRSVELSVSSKRIKVDGNEFTIYSVSDIAESRQLTNIENMLYHDVSNLASGVYSMVQLLNDKRVKDKDKIYAQLHRSSEELLNELNSHKVLSSVEKGELEVNFETHNSIEVLNSAIQFVERMHSSNGNILCLHYGSSEFDFQTDIHLLNRVLVNMLSNALEASEFGEKVTAGCDIVNGEKVLWVHNSGYIKPEIQTKIFRKTFTTKKNGTGYGTQSIRLLTERYLDGRVDFDTCKETGTYFKLYLK